MEILKNYKTAKEILIFSLPIIAGQVGQMLFGLGDMLVAGRYSSLAIASIGIASMIFAPFFMLGMGVLLCTGPIASQLKGENKTDVTFLSNSYIVGFFLSIFLTILIFFNEFYISYFQLTPEIIPSVSNYLKITSFSLFPALVFQATKDYLMAHGKTYIPNATILFYNVLNVLFNIFFMFGYGSFQGMGVEGAAIATLLCRTLMGVHIYLYMRSVVEFKFQYNPETIKKIFKIGTPISFTLLCEVLIFAVVTVLVGGMSIIAGAAQSLVINITSLTFMIPLGISSATSVLVGEEFGKKSIDGIARYASGALFLVFFIQIVFAITYLFIPEVIMGLTTNEKDVILYGSALLFWVGLFQIPDGLQVTLSGVCRGINETKTPMFLGLTAYWIIGLPIGAYFAYTQGLEARGLWIGLTIGLATMCILLGVFYQNRLKKLRQTIGN